MKKIIFKILFFAFSLYYSYSQENCGYIVYQIKGNEVAYSKMLFNNSYSYNEEIKSYKKKDTLEKLKNEKGLTYNYVIRSENEKPTFIYNNRKDLYFNVIYHDGQEDIVLENKKIWIWNISKEIKKIGKFTCRKATTKFRGSNFTAWYSEDIPLPFGPWKAKDLPGLILELYDDNDLLKITAKEVNFFKKNKCEKPIEKNLQLNSISIDQYIKTLKNKDNELIKKLNSKLPKGARKIIPADKCEDCPKDIKLENFEVEN